MIFMLIASTARFNPIALTNIHIRYESAVMQVTGLVCGDIGRSYKSRPRVTIEKRSFPMSLSATTVSMNCFVRRAGGVMLHSCAKLLSRRFHAKITSLFFSPSYRYLLLRKTNSFSVRQYFERELWSFNPTRRSRSRPSCTTAKQR